MVLPKEIGDAAQDADAARVKAWLDSGGDINDGDEENYTLIHCCAIGTPDEEQVTSANVSLAQIALRLLLRAGASLDHEVRHEAVADGWKTVTAEDIIRNNYGYNNPDDERVAAMNALVAGVRKYGTYKKYMRAPHRDVLTMRGLAQRGKLQTDHRALSFLAMQGDNGIVWNILSYWRATN